MSGASTAYERWKQVSKEVGIRSAMDFDGIEQHSSESRDDSNQTLANSGGIGKSFARRRFGASSEGRFRARADRKSIAANVNLTTPEQTSMLVGRGEVRESGLTGVTRNHVSLTAPGVRIPPSPPPSPYPFAICQKPSKFPPVRPVLHRWWQRR